MSTAHAQQDKQASLSDALTKSKEQKKGGPLIDMLSNSGKLMAQKNLPNHVKSQMEQKFNANLDHVKLYESKLVEDTGAHAYAGGASIAFAPSKLDFSSFEGKKLLGHELSHVVNKTSEFEADRAGLQVATGESAFSTTASFTSSFDSMESVITPMSCSDGISDFEGPVAAKKPPKEEKMQQQRSATNMQKSIDDIRQDESISPEERTGKELDMLQFLSEADEEEALGNSEKAIYNKLFSERISTKEKAEENNAYFLKKSRELYSKPAGGKAFSKDQLLEAVSLTRVFGQLTGAQRRRGFQDTNQSNFLYSPFLTNTKGFHELSTDSSKKKSTFYAHIDEFAAASAGFNFADRDKQEDYDHPVRQRHRAIYDQLSALRK